MYTNTTPTRKAHTPVATHWRRMTGPSLTSLSHTSCMVTCGLPVRVLTSFCSRKIQLLKSADESVGTGLAWMNAAKWSRQYSHGRMCSRLCMKSLIAALSRGVGWSG